MIGIDQIELVSVNMARPQVLLKWPLERHPARITVLAVHQALQGSGTGGAFRKLAPLQGKIRRMLPVLDRDLTGGVLERDD